MAPHLPHVLERAFTSSSVYVYSAEALVGILEMVGKQMKGGSVWVEEGAVW
jgi:hypothetical protein